MGEFYALTCGLVWAFAVILFRKSGETVSPFALNLFRVGFSCVLFLVTLLILDKPLWSAAPMRDYVILMVSGVIAIAISDTLFHMCLNRVGAGINALVDTLYSPFVIVFAFFMLSERMQPVQLLGMGLVITGIFVTTRVAPPKGADRRTLINGVLLGVGAMATIAFGIVMAKPVLERHDVLWSTTVRQLGALAVMVPVTLIRRDRAKIFDVFRPRHNWRYALPGTFLGSYLALLLWIAGMKETQAGTAAILNQTSTIHILIFASLFLKEPFSLRKAIAAAFCVAGIILVIQPSWLHLG